MTYNEMRVSVGILTYNQTQYIRQCLDSILMQVTDFDYEIVVGDDASSDGTLDILREYASKVNQVGEKLKSFRVIESKKNEGIAMNYKKVMEACKGKYIALCEGDDYWTDARKLQVQVDFLETHPDYGFVGTYDTFLFPDGTTQEDPYDYFPEPKREGDWELYGNVFDYAKNGPVTRTVSVCFRKSLIEEFIPIVGIGNDLVLQTILAKKSLFAKHSASMCVYRQGGISNDKMSFKKQLYYNQWYVDNRLLQKRLFPAECNWDEEKLSDRGTYILLKEAISELRIKDALHQKSTIRTNKYKNKKYCKYLHGPFTCIILSILYRLNLIN